MIAEELVANFDKAKASIEKSKSLILVLLTSIWIIAT